MIVSFSSPTDRDKKEYVLIGMRPSCLDDKVKITAIDDDSHVGVLFMGLDTYMRLGEDYIRECAYRFNSATTPKTESTQFIGHKPKYTGVI